MNSKYLITTALVAAASITGGSLLPVAAQAQLGGSVGTGTGVGVNAGGANIGVNANTNTQATSPQGVLRHEGAANTTISRDTVNTPARANIGVKSAAEAKMKEPSAAETRINQRVVANNAAAQSSLRGILPAGTNTYTFYPKANVYYSAETKTYYTPQGSGWRASTSAPSGVTLGDGKSVRLEGMGSVEGSTN